MRAGRLRHRVTFQRRATTLNAYGETVGSWQDVATGVPADVVPVSGRERIASGQNLSTTAVRVWVRHREDITTDMRIVHGGQVYAIESAIAADGRRERLEILCTAGQADG
jgi:SPP1 family predicted phage head-tail adaptor